MRFQYDSLKPRRPRRWLWLWAIGLVVLGVFGARWFYNIPAIHWRALEVQARLRDALFPHPDTLPTPSTAFIAPPTIIIPTLTPDPTQAPLPKVTPLPTEIQPTASASPTPLSIIAENLPPSAQLAGAVHEYQRWNNCGPATLATALTFWGWQGTQADTAPVLKPNPDDRNVRPDEMAAYVETTGLQAVTRVGGTPETLQRFVANGFPVLVEKGFWVDEERGWMGHYVLVTGYDDDKEIFTTQDSFRGPNQRVRYNDLLSDWQTFNYLYIVVYPNEREAEVMALLGAEADETTNFFNALTLAQSETESAPTSETRAFAWFNLGTNLNALGRYADAAAAFDQARWLGLPWRMLWYQTGPYRAYYNTGRYQDVIALADATLSVVNDLEESHYWRGLARQALGDSEGAIADFKAAHEFNANFGAAAEALTLLGVTH